MRKARKVSADGTVFQDVGQCAAIKQIGTATVKRRIRSERFPEWFYIESGTETANRTRKPSQSDTERSSGIQITIHRKNADGKLIKDTVTVSNFPSVHTLDGWHQLYEELSKALPDVQYGYIEYHDHNGFWDRRHRRLDVASDAARVELTYGDCLVVTDSQFVNPKPQRYYEIINCDTGEVTYHRTETPLDHFVDDTLYYQHDRDYLPFWLGKLLNRVGVLHGRVYQILSCTGIHIQLDTLVTQTEHLTPSEIVRLTRHVEDLLNQLRPDKLNAIPLSQAVNYVVLALSTFNRHESS